jgi:hypothetical protein
MVLGWQEAAVPELLEQLQQAAPRGSHGTVVLQAGPGTAASSAATGAKQDPAAQQQQHSATKQQLLPPPQQKQEQQDQQHQTGWSQTVLRVGDPCSVQALLEAGIADADAVVLGSALSSAAAPASSEADALVTTAMLAIQQALRTANGQSSTAVQLDTAEGPYCVQRNKLHVVAVVSSYSVRRALQQFLTSVLLHCSFSFEIMVLDEFAAGMLVSVSLQRQTESWIEADCVGMSLTATATGASKQIHLTVCSWSILCTARGDGTVTGVARPHNSLLAEAAVL